MKHIRVPKILNRLVTRVTGLARDASQIRGMITDPALSRSYYPLEEKKSTFQIYVEHVLWLIRNYENNHTYYLNGLDRKHTRPKNYISNNRFQLIRDRRNLHPESTTGYNYVCLLKDKFVFSQFVVSLGLPTPRNLAICNHTSIRWISETTSLPIESLLSDPNLNVDAFCKRLDGSYGEGNFALKINDGRIFSNGAEITIDQLKAALNGEYIIQERIKQHSSMSVLYPHSVNTIRLITFNNNGRVQLFSAACRVGTNSRNVDNWSAGGIVIGIDADSGKLCKEGIYKPGYGTKVQRHPDTDVPFEGFTVPHFHAAKELAMNLHRYLYGIHSIGWDVAILEEGPTVIEGNESWGAGIPMAINENFKHQFLAMYEAADKSD